MSSLFSYSVAYPAHHAWPTRAASSRHSPPAQAKPDSAHPPEIGAFALIASA
jgi:hypothetical protein